MNISNRSEDKSLPEVPEVPELKLSFVENDAKADALYSESDDEIQVDDTPDIKLDDSKIAEITAAIEAMLFVSKDPLKPEKIKSMLGLDSILTVRKAAKILQKFYEGTNRAFELREIADGYLLQSKPDFELIINKMRKAKKKMMMSQHALTILSIVAYKQPITRSEIDAIRGVNSSHHIRTLLENALIKVVGKKSVPGSPRLFGTTCNFLEVFGLKSIDNLPQTTESFEEDLQKIAQEDKIDKNDKTDKPEKIDTEKKILNNDYSPSDVKVIKGIKREFYNPDSSGL